MVFSTKLVGGFWIYKIGVSGVSISIDVGFSCFLSWDFGEGDGPRIVLDSIQCSSNDRIYCLVRF